MLITWQYTHKNTHSFACKKSPPAVISSINDCRHQLETDHEKLSVCMRSVHIWNVQRENKAQHQPWLQATNFSEIIILNKRVFCGSFSYLKRIFFFMWKLRFVFLGERFPFVLLFCLLKTAYIHLNENKCRRVKLKPTITDHDHHLVFLTFVWSKSRTWLLWMICNSEKKASFNAQIWGLLMLLRSFMFWLHCGCKGALTHNKTVILLRWYKWQLLIGLNSLSQ